MKQMSLWLISFISHWKYGRNFLFPLFFYFKFIRVKQEVKANLK